MPAAGSTGLEAVLGKPSRSSVPADLVGGDSSVAPGGVDGAGPVTPVAPLPELNIPGHGDNKKEVARAIRATACVQFNPIPGRLITVTDPADPVMDRWVQRQERVRFISRNADGDVTCAKTMAADEARKRLSAALNKGGK